MVNFKLRNMKNILRVLLLGVLAIYVASCEKKDDKLTFGGEAVLHFTESAYQFIVTPSDNGYDVKVGTTTAASTTVEIAINDASTAIEGVHFAQFSKSVSIGQGERRYRQKNHSGHPHDLDPSGLFEPVDG